MASIDEGTVSPVRLTGPEFTATYVSCHGALVAVVRRLLPLHEAEEVVHEAFTAYFLHPERHDPARGTLLTYLRMLARSKAIDRIRSTDAHRRRDTAWTVDNGSVLDGRAHDRRDEIIEALRQLSPLQREAIVTAFYGDLTYTEAAAALGVPEGTFKTRVRTALARLRDLVPAAQPALNAPR